MRSRYAEDEDDEPVFGNVEVDDVYQGTGTSTDITNPKQAVADVYTPSKLVNALQVPGFNTRDSHDTNSYCITDNSIIMG